MTRKDQNIFDRANEAIRQTESSLVNLLSALAPWGAPLAPAYMAYGGMTSRLDFAPPVALVLAFVVEILGLATVSTTIQFWQHNRRQRAEYRRMPVLVPAGMFGIYLIIIITTNVLLELPLPDSYHVPVIARALLSLLSIPAAVTLAIRTQFAELRREIENAKHAPHHAPQPKSHAPRPTYQCEQCGASFESSGRLAAHVRWGHAAIASRNGQEKEKT